MGRPRKPLPLTDNQIAARYVAGESLETLAGVCGCAPDSIRTSLRHAGVEIRRQGLPVGRSRPRVASRPERCAGDGCHNFFLKYNSSNKRFCQPACRYADPVVAALLSKNIANKHQITDVDPHQARTGTCSVCGPVHVRSRTEKRVHTPAVIYRCRTAERARIWAREYGLSGDDVMDMLERQRGRCATCREPLDQSKFRVDHCHKTGVVRGLLCNWCNLAIGMFRDDPLRMRAAADYVECARRLAVGVTAAGR